MLSLTKIASLEFLCLVSEVKARQNLIGRLIVLIMGYRILISNYTALFISVHNDVV